MQIVHSVQLTNGTYEVTFSMGSTPLTARERESISQFGELIVDFGGEVDAGEGLTQTLPANERTVPSQLPYKQKFTIADYEVESHAHALARAYETRVLDDIETALEELLARTPGSTGTNMTTLPRPS